MILRFALLRGYRSSQPLFKTFYILVNNGYKQAGASADTRYCVAWLWKVNHRPQASHNGVILPFSSNPAYDSMTIDFLFTNTVSLDVVANSLSTQPIGFNESKTLLNSKLQLS